MAEHTPGPWHVDMGVDLAVRNSDEWLICTLPNEANARLVAAAPELLEALELSVPYLCHCGSPDCRVCSAIVRALAAITKAKGDSHA